jgi:ribosomal protein S18 acetylase RimI-like enzyme
MVTDPPVSYRRGLAEDAPALIALVVRCDATHAEWAPAGWAPPTGDAAADSAKLARRIADPDVDVIVAVRDGAPVGFASVRPGEGPGQGHLSNLFVDPSHWGIGIGRGLLARAVEAMRRRGWTTGALSTQSGNARARRLYERSGWRDTGRRYPHEHDGLEMAAYELDLDVD